MSAGPKIDLTATYLFGNDAAEDEDEDTFHGYVVDRPELTAFLEPSNKICVARAFKGEGKSALLRLVQARLSHGDEPPPHLGGHWKAALADTSCRRYRCVGARLEALDSALRCA